MVSTVVIKEMNTALSVLLFKAVPSPATLGSSCVACRYEPVRIHDLKRLEKVKANMKLEDVKVRNQALCQNNSEQICCI